MVQFFKGIEWRVEYRRLFAGLRYLWMERGLRIRFEISRRMQRDSGLSLRLMVVSA